MEWSGWIVAAIAIIGLLAKVFDDRQSVAVRLSGLEAAVKQQADTLDKVATALENLTAIDKKVSQHDVEIANIKDRVDNLERVG